MANQVAKTCRYFYHTNYTKNALGESNGMRRGVPNGDGPRGGSAPRPRARPHIEGLLRGGGGLRVHGRAIGGGDQDGAGAPEFAPGLSHIPCFSISIVCIMTSISSVMFRVDIAKNAQERVPSKTERAKRT